MFKRAAIFAVISCVVPLIALAETPQMKWQDYEPGGFLSAHAFQLEASELALTNRLQMLIADEKTPNAQISKYLQRLITVCENEGKYDAAIQYCQLALRFAEKQHLDTERAAAIRATTARLYCRQGKLTQAELEYNRALQLLSDKSAQAARPVNMGLANVLAKQGRLSQAEKLYRDELMIKDGAFRPSADPADLVAFAHCLFQQNKYAEAGVLLARALRIDRDRLGDQEPAVAAEYNDLACVYLKQGHYADAATNMRAALNICRQSKFRDLADWMDNSALVLQASGKTTEAAALFKESDALRNPPKGLVSAPRPM